MNDVNAAMLDPVSWARIVEQMTASTQCSRLEKLLWNIGTFVRIPEPYIACYEWSPNLGFGVPYFNTFFLKRNPYEIKVYTFSHWSLKSPVILPSSNHPKPDPKAQMFRMYGLITVKGLEFGGRTTETPSDTPTSTASTRVQTSAHTHTHPGSILPCL